MFMGNAYRLRNSMNVAPYGIGGGLGTQGILF